MSTSQALAAPPKVVSTSFSAVTTNSALLKAEVNPEGKAIAYRFEYGPLDCSSNPCVTSPSLEGTLLTKATSPEPVAPVTLEGLTPATTYHFRVVVENSSEVVAGPDTVLTTFPLLPPLGACANDTLRKEKPSGLLPDCRAYEQASAVDKNGADVSGAPNQVQASTDGNAVTFFSLAGLPGGVGAQEFETYLARRGEGSWFTRGVYPPAADGPVARNAGWTPNLSQFFSNAADSFDGPWTFRLRSSADDSFTPISAGASKQSFLAGASDDGSLVYFQNEAQLLPNSAPGKDNLYLWDRDTEAISLVGILPDSACGSPPCVPSGGSFAGPYEWFAGTNENTVSRGNREYFIQNEHAISTDGAKAYFTAAGGQIYLRENASGPSPTTVHVSAPQRAQPDTNGTRPAAFMAATPDGSKAFFTSPEKLTEDATTGPEPPAPAIGRANVGDGSGKTLSFLPTHANGVAVAGEYIYWTNPGEGKAGEGTIGRAKLGAGGPEGVNEKFIEGASNPRDVAVQGEFIYWTNDAGEGNAGEGTIGRAKLGAGGAEEIEEEFIPGLIGSEVIVDEPRGIALDSEYVYWTNTAIGSGAAAGAVARAKLDGSDPEAEFSPLLASGDVAVSASKIYRSRSSGVNGFIIRRNRDGSEDGSEPFTVTGAKEPPDLAVDGSHLYWANPTTGAIGRANLDFSAPEQEFVKEAGNPLGLAVDASHLYWAANQVALPNPGNDLYRFDADTGKLSDISVDNADTNGAEVKGILGVSDDGSNVYFAANGVPDGTTNTPNGRGESAALGNCQGVGTPDHLVFSGECNLYLRHGEETIFIARLSAGGDGSDAANWEPVGTKLHVPENTARVSADGQTLLFRSQRQLSAYDNKGQPQLYRYQLGDTSAGCISCAPTDAPPFAVPTLQSIKTALLEPAGSPAILTRNLSGDGNRIFFESADPLVAEDINGESGCPRGGQASVPLCQDVLEWEAQGTGSCKTSAQNGGCLYLLSSGTSSEPAFFADASALGDDAFIFSRDPLVPQDQDRIQDVYDARVGGGLASQNAVPPTPCESIDGCHQGPAAPPPFESPQTPRFSGPGNGKPKAGCPKGKRQVRRHGKSRCVAKKQHKNGKGKQRATTTTRRAGR